MAPKTKPFNLQTKFLFLTYPQCHMDLLSVLNQLQSHLITWGIESYLLAIENHQDGNPHIHCFLQLHKSAHIVKSTRLDLNHQDILFHGNYQHAKNVKHVIEYIIKHDPELKHALVSPDLKERINQGQYLNFEHTITLLAEQGKIRDAMQLYKKFKTSLYNRSFTSIKKQLQKIHQYSLGFETKYTWNDLIIPQELKDYLNHKKQQNYKFPIYIVGKTGLGKTSLVLAYLQAEGFLASDIFVVNGSLDSLRYFNGEPVILFDDASFTDKRVTRDIFLACLDTINNKKVEIKHGSQWLKPGIRIIISNYNILDQDYKVNGYGANFWVNDPRPMDPPRAPLEEVLRRLGFPYVLTVSVIPPDTPTPP